MYAFCRWADDLGDELHDREQSLAALAWWRAQLEASVSGVNCHPVFVALAGTMREFQIPAQPFHDLISAFEQDQHVTEYSTFAELRDYCRRSADPVGRIVLYLCGQFSETHAASLAEFELAKQEVAELKKISSEVHQVLKDLEKRIN